MLVSVLVHCYLNDVVLHPKLKYTNYCVPGRVRAYLSWNAATGHNAAMPCKILGRQVGKLVSMFSTDRGSAMIWDG